MNATTELVLSASTVADRAEVYVRRSDGWVDAGERLCVELPKLRAAIAAARGGAS